MRLDNRRRQAWWILPCALICSALWQWPTSLHAQAPVAETPAAATEPDQPVEAEPSKAKGGKMSLAQLMLKSGWVGVAFYAILFVFSIISLTVALERLFNLRRGKVLPHKFKWALSELLSRQAGTADEFRRLCATSDSPASRILRAGVLRAGRPLTEVEKSMEDAAASEMADLRGRNRMLYVLGNVGPLIGLLGTVIGMIVTFNTASQKGLGQGEQLAEGIYLALLCTAGGLTIAIPSLLLAALLNTRAERLMREVVECVNETTPVFMRMEGSRPTISDDNSNGQTPADLALPRGEESAR